MKDKFGAFAYISPPQIRVHRPINRAHNTASFPLQPLQNFLFLAYICNLNKWKQVLKVIKRLAPLHTFPSSDQRAPSNKPRTQHAIWRTASPSPLQPLSKCFQTFLLPVCIGNSRQKVKQEYKDIYANKLLWHLLLWNFEATFKVLPQLSLNCTTLLMWNLSFKRKREWMLSCGDKLKVILIVFLILMLTADE